MTESLHNCLQRSNKKAVFLQTSIGPQMFVQLQLSPSGGLQAECRFKAFLRWLHFSDVEATSMFYIVC